MTASEFVTQLSTNAGISVLRVVWVTTNFCFTGDVTESVEYIVFTSLNTFNIQHQLRIKTVVDLRGEDKECLFYGLTVFLFRNAFLLLRKPTTF